jgi:hypothetical protein
LRTQRKPLHTVFFFKVLTKTKTEYFTATFNLRL